MLKNMDSIMIESMQASVSAMKKHMPEIQAQMGKVATDESPSTSAEPA
jgi:hypothetical protein